MPEAPGASEPHIQATGTVQQVRKRQWTAPSPTAHCTRLDSFGLCVLGNRQTPEPGSAPKAPLPPQVRLLRWLKRRARWSRRPLSWRPVTRSLQRKTWGSPGGRIFIFWHRIFSKGVNSWIKQATAWVATREAERMIKAHQARRKQPWCGPENSLGGRTSQKAARGREVRAG